jgi:hypothetical protein
VTFLAQHSILKCHVRFLAQQQLEYYHHSPGHEPCAGTCIFFICTLCNGWVPGAAPMLISVSMQCSLSTRIVLTQMEIISKSSRHSPATVAQQEVHPAGDTFSRRQLSSPTASLDMQHLGMKRLHRTVLMQGSSGSWFESSIAVQLSFDGWGAGLCYACGFLFARSLVLSSNEDCSSVRWLQLGASWGCIDGAVKRGVALIARGHSREVLWLHQIPPPPSLGGFYGRI